jgi:hypothetical protein
VKLHPRDFGQPPETIIELTGLIDRAFHDAGTQPRIWSTGTTYRIATAQRLDERTASNYAVRLFLVTLYARYERMYFYNWGGTRIPITLQAEGGPPTTAARYVERLQQWLSVARCTRAGPVPTTGCPHRSADAASGSARRLPRPTSCGAARARQRCPPRQRASSASWTGARPR